MYKNVLHLSFQLGMSILISVNGLAFKDKPIFNNAAVIEKKLKKINQLQFIVKFVSSYQLK